MRGEDGQATVEFALVAPLLVVLVLAIAQLGILFNNWITLTDAARAGARAGAVSRFESNPTEAARQAVVAATHGLDQTKLAVQVTSTWQPGSQLTITASYPYSVDIFGIVLKSGRLTTTMRERVE